MHKVLWPCGLRLPHAIISDNGRHCRLVAAHPPPPLSLAIHCPSVLWWFNWTPSHHIWAGPSLGLAWDGQGPTAGPGGLCGFCSPSLVGQYSDLSGLQMCELGHITSLSRLRVIIRIGGALCSGKHDACGGGGVTAGEYLNGLGTRCQAEPSALGRVVLSTLSLCVNLLKSLFTCISDLGGLGWTQDCARPSSSG